MSTESVEGLRNELRNRPCESPFKYRIVVVRHGEGQRTAEDQAIVDALVCLGHTVFDLDVGRHPRTLTTDGSETDTGLTQRFSHEPLAVVFNRFDPDIVFFGGAGLLPNKSTARYLHEARVITVALRGSEPVSDLHSGGLTDLEVCLGPALSRSALIHGPLPSPAVLAEVLYAGRSVPDRLTEDAEDSLLIGVMARRSEKELPADLAARAFERVASEHLYEHRLEALFSSARMVWPTRLISNGALTMAPDRTFRSSRRLRPRTILLSGYYGAGNRGDELLLEALLGHFQTKLPELHPVVAAADPAAVERTHGVQAFLRVDATAAEPFAARASSVILGPGGHWHDYSIRKAGGVAGVVRSARVSPAHMAQLPLLVAAYGGSVHVHGMGVGPLADPAARAAVNLTGRIADSVTVRDRESAKLLKPMSTTWPANVVVSPDVVYGLPLPAPAKVHTEQRRRPRYLAVNLRPWSDQPEQRRAMNRAILAVARDHGLAVVGIPMQPTDEPALQDLVLQAPAGVYAEVIPSDAPLQDFLEVLQHAEALVSMRLHANLLMHRMRRSALGLAYDPKVSSHFEQLGRAEFALGLDASDQVIRDMLGRVVREPELPPAARATVDRLEERALQELNRLSDALQSEVLRVPDPGWVRHPPPSRRGGTAAKATPPQSSPLAASTTAAERATPVPTAPVKKGPHSTPAAAATMPQWRRGMRRIYRAMRRRLLNQSRRASRH